MKEAEAHWNTCDDNYASDLNQVERDIYLQLKDETETTLFRICRDLAYSSKNDLPDRQFPLSAEQCRMRLGLKYDMEAHRLFKKFINLYGLLSIHKKGSIRTKGQPPKSNVYKWLL